MQLSDVESVVGRLYMTVLELQKQNADLVRILDELKNDGILSDEPGAVRD